MESQQRYYAPLEQEERSPDGNRGGESPVRNPRASADALYLEVGMKAFAAFSRCLGAFGEPERAGQNAPQLDEERLIHTIRQANAALMADLNAFGERVGRLETTLENLEAGIKRLDKFTLDAFRNFGTLERDLSTLNERLGEIEQGGLDPQNLPARRLSKERATKLALEAGARLRADDERISLASVAREAGLKYGQVMYAFGNKEAFESALDAHLREHPDTSGDLDAGSVAEPVASKAEIA